MENREQQLEEKQDVELQRNHGGDRLINILHDYECLPIPTSLVDLIHTYVKGIYLQGDRAEQMNVPDNIKFVKLCDIIKKDTKLFIFDIKLNILHTYCCIKNIFIKETRIELPQIYMNSPILSSFVFDISLSKNTIYAVCNHFFGRIDMFDIDTGRFIAYYYLGNPEFGVYDSIVQIHKIILSCDENKLYVARNARHKISIYDTEHFKKICDLEIKKTFELSDGRKFIVHDDMRIDHIQEHDGKLYVMNANLANSSMFVFDLESCVLIDCWTYYYPKSFTIANHHIYIIEPTYSLGENNVKIFGTPQIRVHDLEGNQIDKWDNRFFSEQNDLLSSFIPMSVTIHENDAYVLGSDISNMTMPAGELTANKIIKYV